jgi:hypothetical protein
LAVAFTGTFTAGFETAFGAGTTTAGFVAFLPVAGTSSLEGCLILDAVAGTLTWGFAADFLDEGLDEDME